MTLTSLMDDIRSYLERGIITDANVYAQLPHILAMVEKDIAQDIRPQGFERYLTSTFVAGQSIYAKPDRWRETRHIEYGYDATATATGQNTRVPLFPRSLEYCRSYWPDPSITDAEQMPRYYADYGPQNFLIVPTPPINLPYELAIWQLLQPLDDANQTNWMTEFAPQVLLYGFLLACQPYLKEDQRIPVWQGMYQRSVVGLKGQDAAKAQDASVKPEEGVA